MQNLTPEQRESLFGFMSAFDDEEAPDGAWQAMLEEGAQAWADENGEDIDTHDAFMAYVDWAH